MSSIALWGTVIAGIVVLTPLADRIRVPLPVLLTLFGIALPLLPGTPHLSIDPDLVLPVVLPPLLFAATQRSTAREFSAQARPILLTAVGLTIASAALVAVVAHAAGVPWAVAWVLGAIVAPPDPVAATAVARRLRLPGRVVTVLEGEGMFNDATALVMYHVAVAAVVAGSVTAGEVGLDLALALVVGVAVGLALGWLGHVVLGRLRVPAAETTVTLALPFVAYVLAEELHGSGVLAVLSLGLLLRNVSHTSVSSGGWLLGRSVWEYADYLITGVVFVLIGFELTSVLDGSPVGAATLPLALGVVALLVVLRFVWMFPAVWLLERGLAARAVRQGVPADVAGVGAFTRRETTVISWAGMRGVVSVASALALPHLVGSGDEFPHRDTVVFVGLMVVLMTLVLQGLTLAPVVRRLGVGSTVDEVAEIARLREEATRAALESVLARDDVPAPVREAVALQYEGYLTAQRALSQARSAGDDVEGRYGELVDALLRDATEVERGVVVRARNEGLASPHVADEVLADVEARAVRDLD
ncbi:sodium/proton antiporter (CPA1 family) [Isoptericola sp. CG 20/1183]|uniref:Sodium/proton antiporter (CPA1 family) n=1 Tax=Isoptericola halotolerans TaxID=300560 RepID=A0ABX5EDJ6_9MICO|nr:MULTISPECIES: Na+/H+ antiporter [Isoptericola]PRZ06474.1 sodium/proton antiporter (CPA1 family) [Isoptericola halotolerans]PRZ06720.1 sodium/proton antiporter (CPA1 family) [Isoptericola sp. CG 20/1183]